MKHVFQFYNHLQELYFMCEPQLGRQNTWIGQCEWELWWAWRIVSSTFTIQRHHSTSKTWIPRLYISQMTMQLRCPTLSFGVRRQRVRWIRMQRATCIALESFCSRWWQVGYLTLTVPALSKIGHRTTSEKGNLFVKWSIPHWILSKKIRSIELVK